MSEQWVVSDTHFGHANILGFVNSKTGRHVRSFSSVQEMDETIIENWNKTVKPNDIVYHLGDVVINKKFLDLVDRCNGTKHLILGNHDMFFDMYRLYFKKIYAMRIAYKPFKHIMTHIPIHSDSVDRVGFNLHGHIHENSINDPRYRNICVDFPGDDYYPANNYTPLNLVEVLENMKKVNGEK